MFSDARRRFLGGLGILAGGKLLESSGWGLLHAAGQQGGAAARADLWCTAAGDVKVSRGPWSSPDTLSPGVHFESLRLRMPDAVDLTAQVYLPASVRRGEKVPATLITDPYRREPRGDGARDLDGQARNGYAAIYVDVRGSGGSEGMPTDEYSVEEYEDTTRIVDWLSKQAWSNGNVGMYGISYSAFNSLWMAAAIKPPALKAIFLRAGTDNRYTDDVHYPGGTMVMVNHAWALGMLTSNATPGAPDYDLTSRGIARPLGYAPVASGLHPPADRWPLLAAGIARSRLRPSDDADVPGWRDARQVSELRPADHEELAGGDEGCAGPVAPLDDVARAGRRLERTAAALVRSLAERQGHRHAERAAPVVLHA